MTPPEAQPLFDPATRAAIEVGIKWALLALGTLVTYLYRHPLKNMVAAPFRRSREKALQPVKQDIVNTAMQTGSLIMGQASLKERTGALEHQGAQHGALIQDLRERSMAQQMPTVDITVAESVGALSIKITPSAVPIAPPAKENDDDSAPGDDPEEEPDTETPKNEAEVDEIQAIADDIEEAMSRRTRRGRDRR